ncbi:MAG: leucine-rich repeat domain-containing protein, partial [Pseudomonadales bacterium]|nr:leucine-rich repeat domain-containing protein [Pseudomonadales bacterium]
MKTLLPTILLSSLLVACSNLYKVTFNDRVVYNPGAESANGLLEDPNLQGCLNEVLSSGVQGVSAETLTLLACPTAGIQSLGGIGALPNLEQLDLSDNAISDLAPLGNLKKLRVLSIRNNDIR